MNKVVTARQPAKCLSQILNQLLCFDHLKLSKKSCTSSPNFIINKHFHVSKSNFNDIQRKRILPTLIYIQNPLTWIMNKLDLRMLKTAWDTNFDENEFKRGTKQAISVICCLVAENLWDNLQGLVSKQGLARLQRDVEANWSDEQRRNICIEPSDIKVALPRRVHFLKISDRRFADVDMIFVALKFKEKEPSLVADTVLIEMVARFHRNYTVGEIPNWTVSLFKVTSFDMQKRHRKARRRRQAEEMKKW